MKRRLGGWLAMGVWTFGATVTQVPTAIAAAAQSLTIPAATAYSVPNADRLHVSEQAGTIEWTDKQQRIVWFGQWNETGPVSITLKARPSTTLAARWRVTFVKASHDIEIREGTHSDEATEWPLPPLQVTETGYHAIVLESLDANQADQGLVASLTLEGPPVASAHFNLRPRRNAASVHLMYPSAPELPIDAMYCEVTAIDDPVATFYMACGFHRGYFGMQVNDTHERRIIFSVWDAGSGAKADDRSQVAGVNYVQLLAKGADVESNVFGGEGTGGHSHLVYPWKTGEVQRFLLTAQPTPDHSTTYAGYYFRPDQHQWMLIARMRAPLDGKYLSRLHSFSENFWGSTGHVRRKALFGSHWIHTTDGMWTELTEATFSHDATGRTDRRDRFMGIEQGQFFLSHGGFVDGYTKYGERFRRPSSSGSPSIDLDALSKLPGMP